MTHDLRFEEDEVRRLTRGLCSCGWKSAWYALRTTVRRSHDLHAGKGKETHAVSAMYERLLPPRLLP